MAICHMASPDPQAKLVIWLVLTPKLDPQAQMAVSLVAPSGMSSAPNWTMARRGDGVASSRSTATRTLRAARGRRAGILRSMLDTLLDGFRRLFLRRQWEQLIEQYGSEPDVLDLLRANLEPHVEAFGEGKLVLRSPGGRTVRVQVEPPRRWPSNIELRLDPGLGVGVQFARGKRRKAKGRRGPTLRVDHLLLTGRPLALMRAASRLVLERLGAVVLGPGDAITDDRIELALPGPDEALAVVDRVRAALDLADAVETAPALEVLARRFDQRHDSAWAGACVRAIAAIGVGDPAFAGMQLSFMLAHPAHGLKGARLHIIQARSSLAAAAAVEATKRAALRVLAQLPPAQATTALLRSRMDVELAVDLLRRKDGLLSRQAQECLEQGLGEAPDAGLVGRLAGMTRAPPLETQRALLKMLAPHLALLPRGSRAATARGVITRCEPDVALLLAESVFESAIEADGLLPRAQALRLVPLLPEDATVDRLARRMLEGAGRRDDLTPAVTDRLLGGRSLSVMPVFAALASKMPRPAADDLIDAVSVRRLPGGVALLAGFLQHGDEDIVAQVAGPLGRLGGHGELMALGARASMAATDPHLQELLRQAMHEIEVHLGPVQRGGLSMVEEPGGDLTLVADEGRVALVGDGENGQQA